MKLERAAPADRALHAKRRLILVAAGVAAFLAAQLLSLLPGVVEVLYGRSLGPVTTRLLSTLTGIFSFPVAEFVIAAFLMRQLIGAGLGLVSVFQHRRSLKNALSCGALRFGGDVGAAVGLFYVLWGFNYSRAPLEKRVKWDTESAAQVEELATLASEMVNATNSAYKEIHGSDDAGQPTRLPADLRELEHAIDEGWRRSAADLDLPGVAAARYGRVKSVLASGILDRLGLGGFYFPYTGEANINGGIPAISFPRAVAHEKAHQRGFAPENEANFLGFLAALHAPHTHAQYSAYAFAQLQLLDALYRADVDRANHVAEQVFPGVRRDIEDLDAYWAQFRGFTANMSRKLNDAYLRANRVEGGISSYGKSANLIIAYARRNGGKILPASANDQ